MDSGEMLYVMLGKDRVSVSRETMNELGLHPKQTINPTIFRAILEHNIASVQAAIAIKNARASVKSAGNTAP